MRSLTLGLALLLCLVGCGGGNKGTNADAAADTPANVDRVSASDADGKVAADDARQDGVAADAAADAENSQGDATDARGATDGSQGDAAASTPDRAPIDSLSDSNAAPDATQDLGPLDGRSSDAADATADRASPPDGSNDRPNNGGAADVGADVPTFSSTAGAGPVRSYDGALWARSGHVGTVESLDWSRDGARVVSGGYDKTVRIFDGGTGNLQRIMMTPGPLNVVTWSADGAWIVTGDNQATAQLWDGATGVGIRTFTGHKNEVAAATFSPDGATVATGGWDGTIVLWDRASGAVRRILSHTGWIYSLAYSPDGQLLASAADSSLRLWNPATGEVVREIFSPTPMPGADAMTGLAFSPDGTLLLTGSYQDVGRVFKVATGEVVTTLSGHTDWVYAVGWNGAGTRALTAGWDGTIRIWDMPGFVQRQVITPTPSTSKLRTAVWNPTADELAAPDAPGGTIRVWDGATGTALRELTGTAGPVYGLAYSPDGSRIASGGSDGKVRLWNASDGSPTGIVAAGDYVGAVAWSPTGDRIAVAGYNGAGGIWDVATGVKMVGGTGHGQRTNAIAWSPNGNLVAAGGADQLVSLQDLGAGTVQTLLGHTGEVMGVAFSPDGKWLASVSFYREVKIWDTSTGSLAHSLMGGITGIANAVAFSPDGTLLAAAINQNTGLVQLWNTATWLAVGTLASHTMPIEGLAFSRDGLRLVTGAQDQSVRVWDIASGAQLSAFTGTFARVHHVDFAADGAHVAFGDDLGTLAVIPSQ